jgi:hypothetical protein
VEIFSKFKAFNRLKNPGFLRGYRRLVRMSFFNILKAAGVFIGVVGGLSLGKSLSLGPIRTGSQLRQDPLESMFQKDDKDTTIDKEAPIVPLKCQENLSTPGLSPKTSFFCIHLSNTRYFNASWQY